MTYLEQKWAEFSNDYIPKDADAIQFFEMKRAFYMGAFYVFDFLMPRLKTDEEVKALDAEIREFAINMLKGARKK